MKSSYKCCFTIFGPISVHSQRWQLLSCSWCKWKFHEFFGTYRYIIAYTVAGATYLMQLQGPLYLMLMQTYLLKAPAEVCSFQASWNGLAIFALQFCHLMISGDLWGQIQWVYDIHHQKLLSWTSLDISRVPIWFGR